MASGPIPASELVLNPDGSVYHLNLRPEQVGDLIITAGDPGRIASISKHFDKVDFRSEKREFVAHTGSIGNKRITAISTGIGTDNIDIVLSELDALANIDLETRTIRPQKKSLTIVRLGTSGGLQADLGVDTVVVSSYGIGLDNLMHYYSWEPSEEELALGEAIAVHCGLSGSAIKPYCAAADDGLLQRFSASFRSGITVTCSGFYGPQGRTLRGRPAFPHLLDALPTFRFGSHQITNFEMETSGIYGMGRMLGHRCLSVNTIVANRVEQRFSSDPHMAVERMIVQALEVLVQD